jgi:predicted DNA-binding transcriptional regulator AlpA
MTAITTDQYNHLLNELTEMKILLQMYLQRGSSNGDRVGDIELAMEVTGYKKATIYKKIKVGMPHKKDGTKIFFSEKALREWMLKSDEKPVVPVKKKGPGRPSLLSQLS